MAIPSYHSPSIAEIKRRQKKTIPIGYKLWDDVAEDKYHGFIKIGAFLGKRRMDVFQDTSYERKWKYYLVDHKTGKVVKRSHSLDEIWKGVKKKPKKKRRR